MLVLFVFLMLIFSRFAVRFAASGKYQYLALVVLQLLTFALPAAIWYKIRSVKRFALPGSGKYLNALRLKAPNIRHIIIIIAGLFALISGCLLFSFGLSGRSTLEGSFTLYDTFAAKRDGTFAGTVGLILAYAALPAICEELIFRGILCVEYEKSGIICAFVMNSLWFSFIHFNAAKLLTYIFAGVVLTALLYATRSLFVTVILHFLYNLFGLFGQQYITEFFISAGNTGGFIITLIAILLISAAVFCGEARRLYAYYAKHDAPSDYREPHTASEILNSFRKTLLTPSTALCVIVWVAAVVIFIFV